MIPPRPLAPPEQLSLFGRTGHGHAHSGAQGGCRASKLERISWARLIKRTMGHNVDTCPDCGATMKIEGFVFAPDEIAAVLDGRGDPAADFSRSANPARAPPLQLSLDFASASGAHAPRRQARSS